MSAQGGSWPPSTKCDFIFRGGPASPPLLIFEIRPSPGQQPDGSFTIRLSSPPGTYWNPGGPGSQTSMDISVNQAAELLPMPGQTFSRFTLASVRMLWAGGERTEDVVLDNRTEQEKLAAPKIDATSFDDLKLPSGDIIFRGTINLPPGQSLAPNGIDAQYRVGNGPYRPLILDPSMTNLPNSSNWRFVAYQRDPDVRRVGETTVRIIYRQSQSGDDPNFAWGIYTIRNVLPQSQGATSTSPPRNDPASLVHQILTRGGGG